MLCPLTTELKNMDEHLTNCRRMKKLLTEEERAVDNLYRSIEEQSLSADVERQRVERELQHVRPLFSSPGKKKLLERKLSEVKRIQMLADEMET
jgi:hypothetical protein